MSSPFEDRGPDIVGLVWAETSIAITLVALRFYSRIRLQKIGFDDWIMLFSLV